MRADVYLFANGYAESRRRAQTMIAEGSVTVDGKPVRRASQPIAEGQHEVTVEQTMPFVSRGGLKLQGALRAFGIDVKGLKALDIGASTGGFTDCLLQNGAEHVWAVDCGTDQLVPSLRADSRVTALEHFNARELTAETTGEPVDLIVMDVSFISATYIIPRFPEVLKQPGQAVLLIKPQFEVGRELLGKGGIVKDPGARRMAVLRVIECAERAGLCPVGLTESPVRGQDGNREYLCYLTYGESGLRGLTAEQIGKATD